MSSVDPDVDSEGSERDDSVAASGTVCMPAAEALERLRRGETIENARIERLCFRGEFEGPVRMKRVTLVQPRFEGASFQAEVVLSACTIDRPHFGKTCTFGHGFNLPGSTLVKCTFVRLKIHGTLSFDNTTFRGKFVLNQTELHGRVRFWEAHFQGWSEFKKCQFFQEADFRSFSADEGFVLKDCHFHADALFRGSSIAKKFDAAGTRFDQVLDLSKAKLHDYVYLEAIQQGPHQRFAFANVLGDRLRVLPSQIEGRLASEQAGDYRTAMHEYAFLKSVYQALHRYDEEDWAFYRFKVNQRRSKPRTWARPWTKVTEFADWLFLDLGCSYGTHPFRAVRAALLIILLFAAIYTAEIEQFNIEEAKLPFPGRATDLSNRVTIGLFKSVAVFTSGPSSVSDMAKGWMNVPLMAESLLGTLLWGLFIVAFSRKVIR